MSEFDFSSDIFKGQIPTPEPIDVGDSGFSQYQAAADHTHDFLYGNPWNNLLLTAPWVYFGAPLRVPQYSRIGNTLLIRGSFNGAGGIGSQLGVLPVSYRPISAQDPIVGWCTTGVCRVDILTTGSITLTAAPGGAPAWVIIPTSTIILD